MIRVLATVLLSISLCVVSAGSSSADDFQEASVAYERGDFTTAFNLWMPLAEQGDAEAQYNIGKMFENGDGVHQSKRRAKHWYRLASRQDYPEAHAAFLRTMLPEIWRLLSALAFLAAFIIWGRKGFD